MIGLLVSGWTIVILFFLYNEYKINKKYNWFKYPDVVFGYVTALIFNLTIGIDLWLNIFIGLLISEFVMFIILGVLFFILSMMFKSIHSKRLRNKLKKRCEELKRRLRKYGYDSNSKN